MSSRSDIGVSVRVYDDPGWSIGGAHPRDGVGHLVETDHLADARQWVEPALGDRVEDAVPVLGHRTAAELEGEPLLSRLGDVQRVSGVPAPRAVDTGVELRIRGDAIDQSRRTNAFENDCAAAEAPFRALAPERVEHRFGRGIDEH